MSDIFVVKCGGSTLTALPDAFFEEMRALQEQGRIPVIVHGGGPAISETLQQLNIQSEFVDGLRRTTPEVLRVVEMVLAGRINKAIVAKINRFGAKALGISGIDGMLLQARPAANSERIGFVGEVASVRNELLQGIVEMGCIPVVAPLGIDEQGQTYNINADTAAGAVASSLSAHKLIVITDVPGILRTRDGQKSVLPVVSVREIEDMIADGEIYGGMIPKVRAAADCIQGRVREVVIADGSVPGILGRILNGEQVGTRIIRA